MRGKILLFVMIVFTPVFVFAQEEQPREYLSKGVWMLGGTMSLSTSTDFIRQPDFTISPTGGYFITDRWALGLNLGYSIYDVSFVDPFTGAEESRTINQLSITPFTRYYFGLKKFAPFAEAGYSTNWYYSAGGSSTSGEAYRIGTGVNYFISPSLALEGKLSYARSINNPSPYNPVNLGFGLQFFLSRNQNASGSQEASTTFLEKGYWMVGGNVNLSFGQHDYQVHAINPMVGYFLTDKIATGLTFGYNFSGAYGIGSQAFLAAPFVRYYFAIKRFAPFADASFGGNLTKFEYFDGTDTQVSKDKSFSYQVGAGFNYFITNNVAFESRLNYFRNLDNDQGSLSLQAGLKFFLSHKKIK